VIALSELYWSDQLASLKLTLVNKLFLISSYQEKTMLKNSFSGPCLPYLPVKQFAKNNNMEVLNSPNMHDSKKKRHLKKTAQSQQPCAEYF